MGTSSPPSHSSRREERRQSLPDGAAACLAQSRPAKERSENALTLESGLGLVADTDAASEKGWVGLEGPSEAAGG